MAFGTSLPELITGVQAARRGEADLLVGNILGSNTFNSLLVSAVVALAGPGPLVDGNLSGLAVWIMMGISVAAWMFMFRGDGLERWWEGALLLAVYLASLPLLVSDHEDEQDHSAPAAEVVLTAADSGGPGLDAAVISVWCAGFGLRRWGVPRIRWTLTRSRVSWFAMGWPPPMPLRKPTW